jgi:hypothetical protein
LARNNLNTGEMSYEGLGGKRFSQANRDAATNAVEGIAALAQEVGDKLGGARIGGNVAVGVTNGTLYLDVNGQTAQFGNDEAGAKALSEKAAELVLAQFAAQGTVQGDYRKILDATGGGGIERLSENLQFYEQVYKPMIDSAPAMSAFERSIKALRDQFDPAIGKAHELGLAIEAMTAARDKEIAKVIEQRDAEFAGLSASVVSRGMAAGAFGGDRGALIFSSAMAATTRTAAAELEDLKNRL